MNKPNLGSRMSVEYPLDKISKDIIVGRRPVIVVGNQKFSVLPTFIESRVSRELHDKWGYKRQLKTVKLPVKSNQEQPTDFIHYNIIFCTKNFYKIFSETFKNSLFEVYYI